jgi:hypothetical protein
MAELPKLNFNATPEENDASFRAATPAMWVAGGSFLVATGTRGQRDITALFECPENPSPAQEAEMYQKLDRSTRQWVQEVQEAVRKGLATELGPEERQQPPPESVAKSSNNIEGTKRRKKGAPESKRSKLLKKRKGGRKKGGSGDAAKGKRRKQAEREEEAES